jgi:hypothetical protein
MDSDDEDFYIGDTEPNKFINLRQEPKKAKCKLVNIAKGHRGHPTFHFEINGNIYLYGFRGIKKDNKFVLYCRKKFKNGKSECQNTAYILPSEILQQIIQKSPKYSIYPKFLDKLDPRVFDIDNYDLTSFWEDFENHRCMNTELGVNSEKNIVPAKKSPVEGLKKGEFRLVDIVKRRGHPNFHFEINGKIYFYGCHGIKADYTIVLG